MSLAPKHITQISYSAYSLELNRPWQTSQTTYSQRQGFILKLKLENGLIGYGDCAPMPEMGSETLEQAEKAFKQLIYIFEKEPKTSLTSPIHLLDYIDSQKQKKTLPCFYSAIEYAVFELLAKQKNLPLSDYLYAYAIQGANNPKQLKLESLKLSQIKSSRTIALNANLNTLNPDSTKELIKQSEAGYQCFKIKLGLNNINKDIELLEQLLAATKHKNFLLRLDANQAWDFDEAIDFFNQLSNLNTHNIEYIEEPLKRPSMDLLRQLQKSSPVQIALDESLLQFPLTELGPNFHLVLKPSCLAGIRPTISIIQYCMKNKLSLGLSSLLESELGLLALQHLALAVDCLIKDRDNTHQPFHGLGTISIFKKDLLKTLSPQNLVQTQIRLSSKPGLGAIEIIN